MPGSQQLPANARSDSGSAMEGFPQGLSGSWQRCIARGLRREDHALFNNVVSNALTKRVVEENNLMISHARSEMQRLHRNLDSARWLTLCTDTKGQIVHFVGDYSSAPREVQVLMRPGRQLLEAELGTNAPGCVLEERRPVVVSRGEHYLLELKDFFCASVPIFDPADLLIGALDISGVDVRALPLARDLVSFAVRRIENDMVSAIRDCTLLHFHSDERLLGSLFQAMLAVDSNGVIRGSNRTARQLLMPQAVCLLNQPLDSVIQGGLDMIAKELSQARGEFARVQSGFGCLWFLRTQPVRSDVSSPRRSSAQSAALNAEGFTCEDPALLVDCDKAIRVLRAGLPVILRGETGTGKELIARAMHRAVRPHGPFVALNCAAIPESLVEAELFGYVGGAFTGARKEGARGKVEQAHAGLLLLDEIGDMPLALQSRLLRVLQERTVTRVGDSREVPVDLLIVCATHCDLEELVRTGRFREDLFYRLHGYTLRLPPLRERSDIRAIIEGLLQRWSGLDRTGSGSPTDTTLISEAALECLANHAWPGNIRQLEQLIRALLALRPADRPIHVSDLPGSIRVVRASDRTQASPQASGTLAAVEADAIQRALATHDGNISAAARALGISRGTLYKRLKESQRSA